MTLPPLCAIVDCAAAEHAGWAPLDLARACLDGGARLLQLRAKHWESGPFLALCDSVADLAARHDAILIVNDRVDLARLCGAAGVHVGQDDLSVADVRAQLGPNAVVGLSTHTVDQIRGALAEPISYLAVGPVFGTRTKNTGYEAVGVDLVAAAVGLARSVPVVAIGGITLETAPAVWAAGATSVAVITDLLIGDPAARVAGYNRAANNSERTHR